MTSRAFVVRVVAGALALLGSTAPASARATPLPPASRSARASAPAAQSSVAVVRDVIAAIEKSYVFPDKRAAIVARLRDELAARRYDTVEPRVLAERMTDDLRAVSGDRHLYIGYDPAQYAATRRSAGKAAPAASEDADAYHRRLAARDHYGLTEQRLLPGNVRYLKISGFEWVRDETGLAYDDAMRFLRDGAAIIIDLRGNPGGSHSAVRYLVSHFLDEDVLEMTFLTGTSGSEESRTVDHLPAGRCKGKPLYVLIDGNVGSAAEAFAYDVQQFKLGELVGEKTVGAANNNEFVAVAPGYMLSVSMGRPVHAISHGNWDGIGVQPTVPAPPAEALDVAESLALERLARQPGTSRAAVAEYDWARLDVEARLHPVALAAAQLAPLAGRYGDVDITLVGGRLTLSRPARPRWPRAAGLTPLTPNGLFAVDGMSDLRVRLNGETLALVWADDPKPQILPRR